MYIHLFCFAYTIYVPINVPAKHLFHCVIREPQHSKGCVLLSCPFNTQSKCKLQRLLRFGFSQGIIILSLIIRWGGRRAVAFINVWFNYCPWWAWCGGGMEVAMFMFVDKNRKKMLVSVCWARFYGNFFTPQTLLLLLNFRFLVYKCPLTNLFKWFLWPFFLRRPG